MKIVQPTKKYELSNQIASYFKSIYESNIEKIVDFSSISWTPPVLSVLYSSWIQESKIKVLKKPRGTYQSQIYFGEGLYVKNMDQLKRYESKNYLPVIKFSTHPNDIGLSNGVISNFSKFVIQRSGLTPEVANGLKWLLSELTDNIIEHSETSYGWLSYQLYPRLQILDLCICDTGIGLYNSYKNPKDGKEYAYIKNHTDAIEAVLSGDSTKDNKERGYGVRTSIKAIKEGFKGQIVLGSGSAITNGTEVFNLNDLNYNHDGTFLAIRLYPNKIKDGFSLYDYVE